ncbi:S-layer homology domain-containing protein [Paenibacillus sedimenti]|uniref:S-layer homology domain-containing protein n=1 Tax=Paenibacillus sedimenti TaxID=2770274 RepID=A0A926QNY9_9BACL|nr:S-layer homology domain-containing protein [Paenibacillus sedimenti]MBD0384864.1 S-layer homology domain-containing protein [Paenibacillus sedimenti]
MKKVSVAIWIASIICFCFPFSMAEAKTNLLISQIKEIPDSRDLKSITWDQDKTYVVGGYGAIYVSNNGGYNWEEIKLPLVKDGMGRNFVSDITSLLWDGKQFVAADRRGKILVSKDGYDWKDIFLPTYEVEYWWHNLSMVDGKYIGSATPYILQSEEEGKITKGTQRPIVLESDDLKEWKAVQIIIPESVEELSSYQKARRANVNTFANNDEIEIMAGENSLFYKTGNEWYVKPFDVGLGMDSYYKLTDEQMRIIYEHYGIIDDIIWNGKEFIMVFNPHRTRYVDGETTLVYSSKDGLSWEKIHTLNGFKTENIIATEFGSLIFGFQPSPLRFLGFSKDHTDWKITSLNDEKLNAAIWNGKELIAVGNGIFQVKIPPELYYGDYKEGQYWSEDMIWAINKGLITGYKENGNYLIKPSNTLTEAEALTTLYRYFEPEALVSTTSDFDWWASVPYQLAEKDGLSTIASYNDKQGSDTGITRGKFAELLASKHFRKNILVKEAVQFMYDANITTGYSDMEGDALKTFESYGADEILERAHIISFIKRYHDFVVK